MVPSRRRGRGLAQQVEWFGNASLRLTVLLLSVTMILPLLVAPFLPNGERAQLAGPLLPQQAARPIGWKQLLVFGLVKTFGANRAGVATIEPEDLY